MLMGLVGGVFLTTLKLFFLAFWSSFSPWRHKHCTHTWNYKMYMYMHIKHTEARQKSTDDLGERERDEILNNTSICLISNGRVFLNLSSRFTASKTWIFSAKEAFTIDAVMSGRCSLGRESSIRCHDEKKFLPQSLPGTHFMKSNTKYNLPSAFRQLEWICLTCPPTLKPAPWNSQQDSQALL